MIKFAFVKFTGGFGECLWESVRTAIYQGRQSDLRQHICIKFYLTSQEAYLIDGAANVYNREYDNQILFMPYQQGLEALRYKEIAISSIPILTPKVVEKVNQNNSASSLVDVSSYSKNKVDMEALWKEVTATIRISRKYYYEVFFVMKNAVEGFDPQRSPNLIGYIIYRVKFALLSAYSNKLVLRGFSNIFSRNSMLHSYRKYIIKKLKTTDKE